MRLSEEEILQCLMKSRTRVSAAAWVVVSDAHAAEDIFQNVALKAMTRDVVFETEGALMSWVFITARREGIDWLRKHRREAQCLDAEILDLLDREWQVVAPSGEKVDALRDCIDSLPEESKRLLQLRYHDGYPCDDVARKLGVGLNAVYKRISRLHESLRECVECKMKGAGV